MATFATRRLRDIWERAAPLRVIRDRTVDDLWGFCRTCYYADECRAGCTWTTFSLFGRAGNNPLCHHRVLELQRQGMRERLVQVERAPGEPFDYGRFDLILEEIALMTHLFPCPACRRHVRDSESACPFCAAPLPPAAAGAGPRRRMNRAALFAAGATLAGVSACSSSMPLVNNTDGAAQDATANGGAGGQGGPDGATVRRRRAATRWSPSTARRSRPPTGADFHRLSR